MLLIAIRKSRIQFPQSHRRMLVTLTPNDVRLLTPGPLTTSQETKEAMLRDWGSRDQAFIDMNLHILERLLAIANAAETHVCVPLQGSGTFVVEACLCTLIPRNKKTLILINGAYGHRMKKILDYLDRTYITLETPEDQPPSLELLDHTLIKNSEISHVVVVHCETTSGILNPIEDIARVVETHNCLLIIDAMSAFGAIPIDSKKIKYDAVIASSNKCLEGVPGMGFAIIRESVLASCKGNANSLSLDLYDQWQNMAVNAQWRFTPPTHVIAALSSAIDQFEAEGGVAGRHKRYSKNCRILIDGMKQLGFEPFLSDKLQAPIIVTFKMPIDPAFDFQIFYNRVKDQGYVLYPGKLTVSPSFRIGCIGHLNSKDMRNCLVTIKNTLHQMGVKSGANQSA